MTHKNEITDSELSLLIKGGDVDAYEKLFLRYYERAFKFISILVGSKHVAEDLAQDVFLRIWLCREKLDENRSLKNLIFVMSRNAALNHLNSKSSSAKAMMRKGREFPVSLRKSGNLGSAAVLQYVIMTTNRGES